MSKVGPSGPPSRLLSHRRAAVFAVSYLPASRVAYPRVDLGILPGTFRSQIIPVSAGHADARQAEFYMVQIDRPSKSAHVGKDRQE